MKIVSSWDDGTWRDTDLAKICRDADIPVTFYIPVNYTVVAEQKGYKPITPKQLSYLASEHEVGSHTVNHPLLTRIPLQEAVNEIVDSKKMLQDLTGKEITKFCYPRGYANPDIQKAVKDAGYKGARSTLVGYVHQSENPYFEQTTVHVGYDRKEYGGKTWYDYAVEMLRVAKATPGSVYHFWGHGWELNDYPNGFTLLRKLVKELTR